jgi:hypothetical protein
MDLMSRVVSPYDLNPMGKNPLRAILAETINFERLAQAPSIVRILSGVQTIGPLNLCRAAGAARWTPIPASPISPPPLGEFAMKTRRRYNADNEATKCRPQN